MKDIVLFIENPGYLKYTLPYIEIIEDLDVEYHIFSLETSEELGYKNDKVSYFKNKAELNESLRSLSCKCFITTTPGVGNFYFKKSKVSPKFNRPKYIYFFHSLNSPNENYSKNSFNGFDLVFSPNKVISDQLSLIVNTKKTEIVTAGYQYLNKNTNTKLETSNKILIAPSWGKNNYFSENYKVYLYDLVTNLEDLGLEVLLRPHTMDIENFVRLNKSQNFKFYTKNNIDYSLFEYLITDWSGIALEFFYTNKKTVGFLDTPKKIRRRLKKSEIGINLIENEIRGKIGPVLNFKSPNLDNLLHFNYKESEYIDSLFYPKFDKHLVKKTLLKILN